MRRCLRKPYRRVAFGLLALPSLAAELPFTLFTGEGIRHPPLDRYFPNGSVAILIIP